MNTVSAEPLTQALYVSRNLLTDPQAVRELHARCEANNARLGLTGMLLNTGGHFAQLLEGTAPVLDALLARITADTRHEGMRVLYRRPVGLRSCPGWGMRLLTAPHTDAMVDRLCKAASPSMAEASALVDLMRALGMRPGA